jgi:tetratricopeptide (TPR) repeat protein
MQGLEARGFRSRGTQINQEDGLEESVQVETSLLKRHFNKEETEETWYLLSLSRLKARKVGLANLTLQETLKRYSSFANAYNLQGYVDELLALLPQAAAHFKKAAQLGDPDAWGNLAYHYSRLGKIRTAIQVLQEARLKGLLKKESQLEQLLRKMEEKK